MFESLLAPPGFQNHWAPGQTNEEYHSGNTLSVSSTGLREMLKSPMRYKRLIYDGAQREPTSAMIKGTMVHELILEGKKYLDRYAVMPDYQETLREPGEERLNGNLTRVKQKQREWKAENAGKIEVSQKHFDEIRWMFDSLLENDDVMAVFKDCTSEVAGYYTDPKTGILCRLKPDSISRDGAIVSDLKTTVSLEDFERKIWKERYDIQLINYGEGAEQINQRKVQFHVFVVVENVQPFESAVFVADPMMIEIAQSDYRTALDRMKGCIDKGAFPRRHIGFQPVALPGYAQPAVRTA